jgi:hypothetical protein
VPPADVAPLQAHLPCTLFFCRSSLHCSHCDTGRPFFCTSNSGRSLWRQELERCPLMQDWLEYGVRNGLHSPEPKGVLPCVFSPVYQDLHSFVNKVS